MAGTLSEYITAVDDIMAGFEATPQVYDKDVALELIESLKAAFTGDGFGPSDLTAFRRHTIDMERKIKEKEFIGTREEVRRKQRVQIDELWKAMSKSFEAHTNSSTDNIAVQNAKRMRALAKECLSDQEQELMELAFMFRDAAFKAAGADSERYLAWSNKRPATEARAIVLGTLLSMDPHRRIWGFIELQSHIMGSRPGDVLVKRTDGTTSTINLNDIATKIRKRYFNGPYSYSANGETVAWNYAADGNPTSNERTAGGNSYLKIRDHLTRDFPDLVNLPVYVLDTLAENAIICSEMRIDAYIPEYAGYNGSPIPGFDGTSAEQASPIAACLYKAQASGNFPYHRAMFMVARLPSATEVASTDYNPGLNPNKELNVDKSANGSTKPEAIREWNYPGEEDEGTFNEAIFSRSRAPENVRALLWVRDRLAMTLGSETIPKVQLRGDLKIQPTLWNWISRQWEGSSTPLGDITYMDFFEVQAAITAFEDFVDKDYQPPNSIDDITPFVKELGFRIRDVKMLFASDRNTKEPAMLVDDESVLLRIIQRMTLIYIKKLYFKYCELESGGGLSLKNKIKERGATRLQIFASMVLEGLEEAKTISSQVLVGDDKFPLSKEFAPLPIIKMCAGSNQATAVIKSVFDQNTRSAQRWIYFFEDQSWVASVAKSFRDRSLKHPKEADLFKRWVSVTPSPSKKEESKGH